MTTLQRGRVVYVAYTQTTDSWDLSQKILRLARKKAFRRLVVDIRQNGGGNNQKYWPLLDAIKSKVVNRRTRPVLLTGRTTFSAAGNFAADVERFTRADRRAARRVAEPVGRLRAGRSPARRARGARRDAVRAEWAAGRHAQPSSRQRPRRGVERRLARRTRPGARQAAPAMRGLVVLALLAAMLGGGNGDRGEAAAAAPGLLRHEGGAEEQRAVQGLGRRDARVCCSGRGRRDAAS